MARAKPTKEINELAKHFMKMRGWDAAPGLDCSKAINPRVKEAYLMAEYAWTFWAARIPAPKPERLNRGERDGTRLG